MEEKLVKPHTVKWKPRVQLITVRSPLVSARLCGALWNHFNPTTYDIYQQCINSDGNGTYEIYLEGKVLQGQLKELQAYAAGWLHAFYY